MQKYFASLYNAQIILEIENYVVDFMISSISSNPVENKVISNALDNKSDKTITINEHPLAESSFSNI